MKHWYNNLKIAKENTRFKKSTFMYYDNFKDAYNANRYRNSRLKLLNGVWYLKYSESSINDYPLNKLGPDKILVPSHLELNGYGKPKYTQTTEYAFEAVEDVYPPFAPIHNNPCAIYSKEINFSANDLQYNQILVFDGVESAFNLYVNGKYVGYSQDSFSTNEFDITKFLKTGKNIIALKVYKYSVGTWLEDQDFFRFSGIFRDVYLYHLEDEFIKDFTITSKLINNYQDGLFQFEIEKNSSFQINLNLYDEKEKLIYSSDEDKGEAIIKNIKPWSYESPTLYHLVISYQVFDKLIYVSKKIGFKTIEIKNNIILINGQRLVIKGVNRHEWNSQKGRAISHKDMLEDIKIIKSLNINSIRTSHYPNHPYFYELCSEYGIYIMNENNLETHGTWFWHQGDLKNAIPGSDHKWDVLVMDRIESLYERDKNETCIISYSLGNESFGGDIFLEMANYLRQKKVNAFIHYEGVFHYPKSSDCSDVESHMYSPPEVLIDYANNNPKKPFVLCEFGHSMGNSLGDLNIYTQLFDSYEVLQGGYIWDYKDQALLIDGNLKYGGDFGEITYRGDFSGNGIVNANNELYPMAYEVFKTYQNVSFELKNNKLIVYNKFLFTNLKKFELHIIQKDNKVLFEKTLNLNIKPGEVQQLDLDLINIETENYLNVKLINPNNNDKIAYEQFILNEYKYLEKTLNNELFNVFQSYGTVAIKGNDYLIRFNSRLGQLTHYEYKDVIYIKQPLIPNFWRPMTANDIGSFIHIESAPYKEAGNFAYGSVTEVKTDNNRVYVKCINPINTIPKSYVEILYIITGREIQVEYTYKGNETQALIPAIGMELKLSKEFNEIKYLGKGPYDNYIDRNTSSTIDYYHEHINDFFIPYLKPQQSGNRTKVRKVSLINKNNNQLDIIGLPEFEFSASKYDIKTIEWATHVEQLKEGKFNHFYIRYKQMGLGGIDSWGSRPRLENQITSNQTYKYKFKIIAN